MGKQWIVALALLIAGGVAALSGERAEAQFGTNPFTGKRRHRVAGPG